MELEEQRQLVSSDNPVNARHPHHESCFCQTMTMVNVCHRHFGQSGVCRTFAGGSAGVGNSTKAPSTGEDQRGESAGSQHDEDYMSNLKETQGKAGE